MQVDAATPVDERYVFNFDNKLHEWKLNDLSSKQHHYSRIIDAFTWWKQVKTEIMLFFSRRF